MEKKFKPFDKVLTRYGSDNIWVPDFYSYYYEEEKLHASMLKEEYFADENILHYEGNEHLVGRVDEPNEKIQVKYWEWIMALNGCLDEPSDEPSEWYLEQFNHISGKENIETKLGHHYCYFIRFSDFNPNDMEETRKHILYVKNGKIVKYKG